MSIPYIGKDEHGITTLYVDGRPFFCRSGEIHNSSASDPDYMAQNVWPNLRGLNMNSVIAPVYWELIEPTEGDFDFSSVDSLIKQAREEGLRLIFLWFGLWKNAESFYAPAWVKKDTKTYFRAQKVSGEPMTTISPLCTAAVQKDAAAFTKLMGHIRDVDGEQNTVIVIQVENEIGLLGTDRDYSPAACEAFAQQVPAGLSEKTGTWQEVFGDEAGEAFMAWYFASAVEKITAAGREVHPLPCYANAWLKQYPWFPGSYPSGGPVETMHKIWRAAAPSLFAFGPDIYVPYCADVMDTYATDENPLFIPEIRKDAVAASYVLYAWAAKNAICFSPFGIEELALDPALVDKPPMEVMIALNIDPSAFDTAGSKDYLARAYELIDQMDPLYRKYRGSEHLKAFVRHGDLDYGTFLKFEDCDIAVAYDPKRSATPLGSGVVFELGEGRFLIAGMSCGMTFRPKTGRNVRIDILRMEEGSLVDGEWKRGRVLNGDEKMSLRFGPMPELRYVEVVEF